MFSYREKPWHGIGTILEEAPNSEEALIAAGLDWEVQKQPVFIEYRNGFIDVPEQYANVRTKDNRVLGIVGKAYKVVQNKEAFAWTDALLGEGCKYETAGALREGRKVWLSARLPEPLNVLGDQVDMYLVFSNSHDGNSSVKVAITPIRVVCENTLTWGLRQAKRTWSLRHTQSLNHKLDEAAVALGLAQEYSRAFALDAERLAERRISLEEYLDKIIPIPEKADEESRVVANIQEQREHIANLYRADDLRQFQGTGWGALQAVADYVSHAKPKRETNTYKERRFEQLIEGHQFLQKAYTLARAA